MATDPVCGMTVSPDGPLRLVHEGRDYRFCSRHCLDKFRANPAAYVKADAAAPVVPVTRTDGFYACPMHPEIRQPAPGRCPKCGMTLEFKIPSD